MKRLVPLVMTSLFACTTAQSLPDISLSASDLSAKMGERVVLSAASTNARATAAWRIVSRPEGSTADIERTRGLETTLVPDVEGTWVLSVSTLVDERPSRELTATVTVSGECAPDVSSATVNEGAWFEVPAGSESCEPGRIDGVLVSKPEESHTIPSARGFFADAPGMYQYSYTRTRGLRTSAEKQVSVLVSACDPALSISFPGDHEDFFGFVSGSATASTSGTCAVIETSLHIEGTELTSGRGVTSASASFSAFSGTLLTRRPRVLAYASALLASGRRVFAQREARFYLPYIYDELSSPETSLGQVQGRVHVVAYASDIGALYALEPDVASAKWRTVLVDNEEGTQVASDIGSRVHVDSRNDVLSVAYIAAASISAPPGLRYAERSAAGAWAHTNVQPSSAFTLAASSKLRMLVDDAGAKHIWKVLTGNAFSHSLCTSGCDSGGWSTLASYSLSPAPTSVAFDVKERAGTTYLAYLANTSLFLTRCESATCTTLANPELISTTASDAFSIGFDEGGVPLVSYIEPNQVAKVRRCAPSCASGTTEVPFGAATITQVAWPRPSVGRALFAVTVNAIGYLRLTLYHRGSDGVYTVAGASAEQINPGFAQVLPMPDGRVIFDSSSRLYEVEVTP
jgi:hypothetical protein